MNFFVRLFSIFLASGVPGCSVTKGQMKLQADTTFLQKPSRDTGSNSYKSHIEVKQVLPKIKEGFISNNIDDRDIIARSNYSREDQIKILGEYLMYRGDTTPSNKKYAFKGGSYLDYPKSVEGFTIEIEALYSFTRMLTIWFPPIKPTLIRCTTGEELNTNPKAVSEVYDIYEKWYDENKKTDYKNISLPLTGSPYCWLGEDKGMEPFLKKSF